MEKTKTLGWGRKFLSNHFHEGSVVRWCVDQDVFEHHKTKKPCRSCSAFLEIRDCTRTISLDFYFSTERERKQRVKKITKLIDELVKMRDCLEKVDVTDD